MVIPPIPVFHGFSAPRASIAAGLRPAAPGGAATLTAPGASAQGPRGPGAQGWDKHIPWLAGK